MESREHANQNILNSTEDGNAQTQIRLKINTSRKNSEVLCVENKYFFSCRNSQIAPDELFAAGDYESQDYSVRNDRNVIQIHNSIKQVSPFD